MMSTIQEHFPATYEDYTIKEKILDFLINTKYWFVNFCLHLNNGL